MTNYDYIKAHITERDLAYYEFSHFSSPLNRPPLFIDKIYYAFRNWAESCSSNRGNMAKGCKYRGGVITENTPIWVWENWYYSNGDWKTGRNQIVAFQVWLSMQYKPEEWD